MKERMKERKNERNKEGKKEKKGGKKEGCPPCLCSILLERKIKGKERIN